MIVYTGADSAIRSVARAGWKQCQIVAASKTRIFAWNVDGSEPAEVLDWNESGFQRARLFAPICGNWLIGCGRNSAQIWRRKITQWGGCEITQELPGLCAASTQGNKPDLHVVAAKNGQAGVELLVANMPMTSSHDPKAGRPERFFPASPSRLASDTQLSTYPDLSSYPWYASDLSPDGRWFLLSVREKAAHVWDTSDGRALGSVRLKGIPNEAAFSPDGLFFAVDCGTTVYIHHTHTLERIAEWKVRYSYVPRLAWSPDCRRLGRTDLSTTVRLFDVNAAREVSALSARRQRATTITFSPDGLTYLVGTANGCVVAWDMD
jgi:WD40 repeat protein